MSDIKTMASVMDVKKLYRSCAISRKNALIAKLLRVQGSRGLFERFDHIGDAHQAEPLAANDPVLVNEEARGQARQLVEHEDFPVRIEQVRIRDPVLTQKLLHGVGLIVPVDPDDVNFLTVLAEKLLEIGHLFATRGAQACPKIEQDGLAAQRAQSHTVPMCVLQFEVWGAKAQRRALLIEMQLSVLIEKDPLLKLQDKLIDLIFAPQGTGGLWAGIVEKIRVGDQAEPS